MPDTNVAQQRCNAQQRGNACPVVRNSRPVDAASLLADIQRRVRGKHGVNMRAQCHIAPSKSGMDAEYVAHIIDPNIVQPDFTKAFRQPGGARRLAKRRRRNPRHLHLPVRQLRFLGAKPVECGTYFRGCRQARHLLLHRGHKRGVRELRARGIRAHGSIALVYNALPRNRDWRGRYGRSPGTMEGEGRSDRPSAQAK